MLLDFFTNSRAQTETIMSKSSLKTFDRVSILINPGEICNNGDDDDDDEDNYYYYYHLSMK